MTKHLPLLAFAALSLSARASAEEAKPVHLSPGEIVAAAPAADWVAIAPSDLLVMDLAPDARGQPRRVVIQLMPAPFSQGWIGNIRKLAAAKWWDGTSINRVQDNYVVQWGDPDGEDAAKAKALPAGLAVMKETDYVAPLNWRMLADDTMHAYYTDPVVSFPSSTGALSPVAPGRVEGYPVGTGFVAGWPVAGDTDAMPPFKSAQLWPVHCYGMVGVGRGFSPDTGSGAELYTVIGHAPRHLDRNIALVGRIVSGMEYLSSLPRGTGDLGFYLTAKERTPIVSMRIASELPETDQPRLEYLSTRSKSFANYLGARANRRDAFFITPAGGADICNIPVPVRKIAE